jgi:hypothetical protein
MMDYEGFFLTDTIQATKNSITAGLRWRSPVFTERFIEATFNRYEENSALKGIPVNAPVLGAIRQTANHPFPARLRLLRSGGASIGIAYRLTIRR